LSLVFLPPFFNISPLCDLRALSISRSGKGSSPFPLNLRVLRLFAWELPLSAARRLTKPTQAFPRSDSARYPFYPFIVLPQCPFSPLSELAPLASRRHQCLFNCPSRPVIVPVSLFKPGVQLGVANSSYFNTVPFFPDLIITPPSARSFDLQC